MNKREELKKFSNFGLALKKAMKYLGNDVDFRISTRKDKKYMVKTPDGKWSHFGQMGYEDHTKHQDALRRQRYLDRATRIRGNWKKEKYSPNNLSINILW
jgi:hypothetical protein|tara:strand:- start:80 stop:379 length:300 start_codon:yes stop_codon:yes gene_type:complete